MMQFIKIVDQISVRFTLLQFLDHIHKLVLLTMATSQELLKNVYTQLVVLHDQLKKILSKNGQGIVLCHKELRDLIYNFTISAPKPTIRERASINHKIRQNIKNYIKEQVQPKINNIIKRNDPYNFVQSITQIWENYQRYTFAHQFVADKLKQFVETFYKMGNAKDFHDGGQIAPIPTIAVTQMHTFFQKKKIFAQVFPKIFSTFLAKQRENTNVPRQTLRQSIHAIQGCFFDYQAMVVLDENKKAQIKKNPKGTQYGVRRAKDGEYFEKYIIKTILDDSESYYKKYVKQVLSKQTSTEQIQCMLNVIKDEEARALFYIHTAQNQKKYNANINQFLIGLDLPERIRKPEGLSKYLRSYQLGKPEFQVELQSFWKIYSRILDKSLPFILEIYNDYMDEQAKSVEQKIQKFALFIPQLIRINSKNIKIVEIFTGNFELENKRNEKIRGMLSNQIIKDSQFKGKHTMGASNLAQFVNVKFKQAYGKGTQGMTDTLINLQLLFKILQQKVHFTKQHQKFIANRLLEDIDFSKDNEYSNIIQLQKKFIDEMQKETGVSQVKQLLQNVRDIQKSADHTKKIKEKVGSKIHILSQVIVKNNTFWPQKTSYQIIPPNLLLPIISEVQNYFSKTASNIQFQLNNGVSLFKGDFKSAVPKQNFQLKNIYLIILLLIDEAQGKKILYGDLKNKIKSFGGKKEKGNLELARNIIELLHNGMLISNTKKINKQDPKVCKLVESDLFEINTTFNFEEQQKKNKMPPNMIKKLPVIKTTNIALLPQWLKKAFTTQSNEVAEDQINIQKERRVRVKQISVRTLKHAHHSNKDCTFEQLFQEYNTPKHKQFRVTQKYLKQVIQELINDEYCQRVQGQRNVFKYKA